MWPKSNDSVLIKERRMETGDAEGEALPADGQGDRDWREAATSQGMPRTTGSHRRQGRTLSRALRGAGVPRSWSSDVRTPEWSASASPPLEAAQPVVTCSAAQETDIG